MTDGAVTAKGQHERTSEADLFGGYRLDVPEPSGARVERCVCGGTLVAIDDEAAIRLAVEQHRATIRHQAWWAQVYG